MELSMEPGVATRQGRRHESRLMIFMRFAAGTAGPPRGARPTPEPGSSGQTRPTGCLQRHDIGTRSDAAAGVRSTRCAQLLQLAVGGAEVQVDAARGEHGGKRKDEKGFHRNNQWVSSMSSV